MIKYKVGEDTYNIPKDQLEDFKLEFPEAEEIVKEVKENGVAETDASVAPEENTASNLDPGSSDSTKIDNSKEAIIARRNAKSTQSSSDPLDYANYDIGSDSFILPEELEEVVITAKKTNRNYRNATDIKKRTDIGKKIYKQRGTALKSIPEQDYTNAAAESYFSTVDKSPKINPETGEEMFKIVRGNTPSPNFPSGTLDRKEFIYESDEEFFAKKGILKDYQNWIESGKTVLNASSNDNKNRLNKIKSVTKTEVQDQTLNRLNLNVDELQQSYVAEAVGDQEVAQINLDVKKDALTSSKKELDESYKKLASIRAPFEKANKEILKEINEIDSNWRIDITDVDSMKAIPSPRIVKEYNKSIQQYNDNLNQFAVSDFNNLYDSYVNNEEIYNNNVKDFNKSIVKFGSDQQILKSLDYDYSNVERLSANFEKFFVGDTSAFAGNAVSAIGKTAVRSNWGFQALNEISKQYGLQADGKGFGEIMLDAVFSKVTDIPDDINRRIDKRIEKLSPVLTRSDIGKDGISIGNYLGQTAMTVAPSTVTSFTTVLGVARASSILKMGSKLSAQAGIRNPGIAATITKEATRSAQNALTASKRFVQGTFFAAESGGSLNEQRKKLELSYEIKGNIKGQINGANLRLKTLKDKTNKTTDEESELFNLEIDLANLQKEYANQSRIQKLTKFQKSLNAYAFGGVAAAWESWSTIRLLSSPVDDLVTKYGKDIARESAYKGIRGVYQTIVKPVVDAAKFTGKAVVIENVSEFGTLGSQNIFSGMFLGENVAVTEGMTKEMFDQTTLSIFGLTAGKTVNSLTTAFTNEFRSKAEITQTQTLIKRALKLHSDLDQNIIKDKTLREDASSELETIVSELAFNDSINLYKLSSMTFDEIKEVADKRRIQRELIKNASGFGLEGAMLNESANKNLLNKLQNKFKLLDEEANLLLQKHDVNNKKSLKEWRDGADMDSRIPIPTNPRIEYDYGINQYFAGLANTLGTGEYNSFTTIEEFENIISKFDEAKQNKLRENYTTTNQKGETILSLKVFGEAIDNDIFINQYAVNTGISIGNKWAVTTPLEELFHQYNKGKKIVDKDGNLKEDAELAINQIIDKLKIENNLGRIKDEDYKKLSARFNQYKNKDGQYEGEEILAQLNNAVALGILDENFFKDDFAVRPFLNNMLADALGNEAWMLELKDSKDIYRFIERYQSSVVKNTPVKANIPKDEKELINQFSLTGFGSEIDAFAPKEGQSLDQYKQDPSYFQAYEAIGKDSEALNSFILKTARQYGIESNLNVEAIRENLQLRFIKNYDPVKNPSLFGWMTSGKTSPIRGAVLDQIKAVNQTPTTGAQSFDIAQGETGAAPVLVAEEVSIDETIKIPESQLKQKAPQLIDQTIENNVETAVLEIAEGVYPDVKSKEFLPFVKEVIAGKLTDTFKKKFGTREQYDDFINKLAPSLKRVMPASFFVKLESTLRPEQRKFTEAPVRLTTQADIDKARDNEQINYLENDAQGVNLYKLKKFTPKELASFINPPAINPKTGKKSGLKGTRKTSVATSVATQSAFDMIPSIFKGKVSEFELAKISEKIQRDPSARFSEGITQEELNVFMMNEMIKTSDDFANNSKNISLIGDKLGITNQFDMATEDGRKDWRDWAASITNKNGEIILPKEVLQTLMGSSESVGILDLPGAIPGTITDDNTTKKSKEPVEIRDYVRNLPFLNNATFEQWAEGKKFIKLDTVWKDMLFSVNPKAKKLNGEDIFKSKAFNKSQDNSIEGLKQLAYIFQDLMSTKKVIDEKTGKETIIDGLKVNGAGILAMMATTSANQNQLIRRAAPWRFFQKGFLTEEMVEEHTLPASIVSKYILIQAALGKLDQSWENLERNFFQGALLKVSDNMLAGIGVNGKKFSYKSKTPDGWLLSDNIWARYFNINVASNNLGGISPTQIVQYNGKTVFEEYGVNSAGYEISKVAQKESNKAAVKNNGLLPKKVKLPKNSSNPEVLNEMKRLDTEANDARDKFSKGLDLNEQFNFIIQKATGIGKEKQYGQTKARAVGADKGRWDWAGIPPSAQDFVGLTRYFAGKGKEGDKTIAWVKENFLDPFARANIDISNAQVSLANDFKGLKKLLGISPKDLNKKIPGEPYTIGNAIRVYTWGQQGMKVPGLSKADQKTLEDLVTADKNLQLFASELIAINKDNGYPKPQDSWLAGTITTDLLSGLNTVVRAKYLKQWQNNVNEVFTEANMNKLEAAYGKGYRDALENMLGRMKTGSNRGFKGDTLTGRFTDWINGAVGSIMFFNMRSAVLQTISAVNFINLSDNNMFKAAAAFANQPQYWGDVVKLMNSDYLIQRRNGLKINVNEADIAEIAAESKNKAKAFINKLLKLGFLPTQIADSFAIASGGATFYRNRLKSLIKDGMSQKEAEAQAFQDFREIAEESQQSSRPDRISAQQAGPMGRIVLAFANTPAQYARLMQKAASDLKNRRGDDKTNISKIIYYGAIQNVIFNALQQALFAMAFGDEEPDEEKMNKKYTGIVNGMADSLLRGIGFHGAAISTLKNVIMKLADGAKAQDAAIEMLDISPPVSSKIGKLRSAGRTWDWNKKEIMEKGWSLDNPAYLAAGQVVSAATNVPLDRGIRKLQNLKDASDAENEEWMRVANALGWAKWELEWQKDKPKKNRRKSTSKSTGKSTSKSTRK